MLSDAKTLAVQAVALRVLADRVKEAAERTKQQLAAVLDVGDRKTAVLDDGTKVGAISYATGARRVTVVDERAFTEWVLANYPDEIIPHVRTSFRDALFSRIRDTGEPVDTGTGEVIPGVETGRGVPYLAVKPNPDTVAALVDAIRQGQLLALEAGDQS